MPTFGSLFAGIGGIDLGLERAGWDCRFQVEWDPYCQHVLAHHWPDVPRYGDITAVDWSGVERVDLLAGGFPCQPFSNAGKRRGVEDERWLWPEFARAIGELRPRYVLVENVPGLLARHGGMGRVLGDLAELGYDAEWDSIPASAVGAPHLRYRVWIVAYANGLGRGRQAEVRPPSLTGLRPQEAGAEPHGAGHRAMADASGERQPRSGQSVAAGHSTPTREGQATHALDGGFAGVWSPQPNLRGVVDGFPQGLDSAAQWVSEWEGVPRVAQGVPDRVHRLKALGNAVVPQVVEVIGRRLLETVTEEAA